MSPEEFDNLRPGNVIQHEAGDAVYAIVEESEPGNGYRGGMRKSQIAHLEQWDVVPGAEVRLGRPVISEEMARTMKPPFPPEPGL